VVHRVVPGSGAAQAGLRGVRQDDWGNIFLGDVIVQVGDVIVRVGRRGAGVGRGWLR
jgi:S1-C subfamily serine protease